MSESCRSRSDVPVLETVFDVVQDYSRWWKISSDEYNIISVFAVETLFSHQSRLQVQLQRLPERSVEPLLKDKE